MDTNTKSKEIVASEDCLATTIESETVILHTGEGTYYGFNEVGSVVWEFIQQPRQVEEIHRHVASEYEVDEERCRSDIEELVVELSENGLVRFVEE